MKIEDYKVSEYYGAHRERHVSNNNNYLCGFSDTHPIFPLHLYSKNDISGIPNIPICKICLNKLPIKVKEEFIYNWTISKLKAK